MTGESPSSTAITTRITVRINEVASAAAEILPRSVPNRAMTFSRKPEIDIFGSLNVRTSQIVMNPCIQTGFRRAQNSVTSL
jgi:hypothetical protein